MRARPLTSGPGNLVILRVCTLEGLYSGHRQALSVPHSPPGRTAERRDLRSAVQRPHKNIPVRRNGINKVFFFIFNSSQRGHHWEKGIVPGLNIFLTYFIYSLGDISYILLPKINISLHEEICYCFLKITANPTPCPSTIG